MMNEVGQKTFCVDWEGIYAIEPTGSKARVTGLTGTAGQHEDCSCRV